MSAVSTIARKEFVSAFRHRMFVTITALFLLLSVLSVSIGSTTKRHEMRVYEQRVATLTAAGDTALPPRPQIHSLTILANLIEYVGMVGAILAIILAHDTVVRERESGGLALILSRPVFRDTLLTGKLAGAAGLLAVLMAIVFVFNVVLTVLVGRMVPSGAEIARLAAFIVLAWLYMVMFLALTLAFGVRARSSSNVFLVSLVVWVLVSFVLPQVADALMHHSTVASIASGVTSSVPQETTVSRIVRFLSPTEHLRRAGAMLLESGVGSVDASAGSLVAQSLGAAGVLVVVTIASLAYGYVAFLRDETVRFGRAS